MKKILIVSGTVLILCFAVYSSITSYSQASNTYNNDEYYYNEDTTSTEDGVTMTSNDQTAVITENATTIDKRPNSITVLVNKEYSLPSDYVPEDLIEPDVLFNINYHDDKRMLRKEAAHALEDLFADAEDDGLILYGISGYRSYARQNEIYTDNVRTMGIEHTNLYSAKPGFSEHQTGLSMDVSTISVNNRLDEGFAATPESKWLEDNCYRFGFIIRYPEDKCDITGYSYEPWHIRYVGKPLAAYLYEHDLTLEEYYNYTPSAVLVEDDSYGTVIDVDNEDLEETEETVEPTTTPTPLPSVTPTVTPVPTKEPAPTEKPTKPVKTPKPTHTPIPTLEPVEEPTDTPFPSETPVPEITPSVTPSSTPQVSVQGEQIPSNN